MNTYLANTVLDFTKIYLESGFTIFVGDISLRSVKPRDEVIMVGCNLAFCRHLFSKQLVLIFSDM